jgi:type II secretory pathway component GspD/PulD (secretin)
MALAAFTTPREGSMRDRLRLRLLVTPAVLAAVIAPAARGAATLQESPSGPTRLANEDDGIPITDFVRKVSSETGKSLLFAPAVENTLGKRRVKILQPPRVATNDLFDYYRDVLKTQDLVLIPFGPPNYDMWVVDDAKAAGPSGALRARAIFVPSDELEKWRYRADMITTVIHLKNVDPTRAHNEVTTLADTRMGGAVTNVAETRSFVVTDFAPTVWAIYQCLTAMDRTESTVPSSLRVVPLQTLECEPLATELSQLVDPSGADARSGVPVTRSIVAERQTNSLLVRASQERFDEIRALVDQLEERARAQRDAANRAPANEPVKR